MPRLNRISGEKLAKILLIIFACSTIISALSIYYTHQLPTQETQTTTLCSYQHTGTYNYVAELKPNLIYNKTTLTSEDNATLYTAIAEYINLTFTYGFACNPLPDYVMKHRKTTTELASPGRWTKTLSEAEAEELLDLSGIINFTMQVNCTKIKELVNLIDTETGTRSSTYNINVKPEIHVTANVTTETTVKTIDETFTPELTVAFKAEAEKGNYIAIENLNQTRQGAIIETEQITLPHTQNQRTASYIATATTAAALTISAFLYIKYKPAPPPTKIIEKLTAPYKELIAKTTQKPPETENTIETETLEDLAKIAEILARPILHVTENGEHTFYIIDNNTKYQHKTKA
jgi:hypothetical protein